MHLRMTGNTGRTRARGFGVPFVVTGLAFRLRVSPGQAQARMILPYIGDLTPVGLVVTRGALGTSEPSFVRVLVTGHALGLQPEKRGVAPPVRALVTILAPRRRVTALERPPRLAMIEARLHATRPTDELCIPAEMLDVTLPTLLPAVLATVQTSLLSNSRCEVIVARETSAGVEPLTGGMAFAAFRVALEIGMRTAELAGG